MKKIILTYIVSLFTIALLGQYDTAAIRHLIEKQFSGSEPGGVVLVAKGDRIVYEQAFGMANLELEVPMKKDMLFNIASITKQFTAVAILQLVEEGKLSLTDTVGRFIPEYLPAGRGITIAQLLSHTAGIPNAVNVQVLQARVRGWIEAKEVLATFKDLPIAFEPGTRWSYSNTGYQLLGCILERVAKTSYEDYVTTRLLIPAGMSHSQYGNNMKIVHNRASDYIYTRVGLENGVSGNPQVAFSAGALQCTIEDYYKWIRALHAGLLVSREMLDKAWTEQRLPDSSHTYYGYGWFTGNINGYKLVENGGNMGGFMSHTIYLPGEDVLVVVFYNFRGRLPEILASQITAIVTGKPLQLTPVDIPAADIQEFTGLYVDNKGGQVEIRIEKNQLVYQRKGKQALLMIPVGKHVCWFDNTSVMATLIKEKNGKPVRLDLATFRDTNHISLYPVTGN